MALLEQHHIKNHTQCAGTPPAMQVETNRPPKGDRSEGFYIKISMFIDFPRFRANSIENTIFIYGNLAGMIAE